MCEIISKIPASWIPAAGKIKIISFAIAKNNQQIRTIHLKHPLEFNTEKEAIKYLQKNGSKVFLTKVEHE